MGRKLLALLALALVLFPPFAEAANRKPPDVPAPVVQTATYAASTTLNKLGAGGTATVPDTPPYYTGGFMPSDIATSNRTSWLKTQAGSDYNCGNVAVICEAKFRSILEDSHVLYDDPIRNYGEPGTSHCHDFFGNDATNAFSTYATLRTRNRSHSTGGDNNATGYWAPCQVLTNPFGNGKNYAVRADVIGLYYTAENYKSAWLVPLPPGLRYVGGTNMDDPEDTTRKRAIVVANAQASTSGRYSWHRDGYWGNTDEQGIICMADTNTDGIVEELDGAKTHNGARHQRWLNSTTGLNVSDPWLGNCKTNTTNGQRAIILIDFFGPECWDGINPWVPGGYNHVRYGIKDVALSTATGGRITLTCPNGWYHIPPIQLKVQYMTTGWSDYSRWRLASDDTMQATLNALPLCTTDATGAYANAPCATRSGPMWNGTSYSVPNGASFHTDWMMGWDGLTAKMWQAGCLGVRGLYDGNGNITSTAGTAISSTPHTCDEGQIKVAGTSGATSTFLLGEDAPPAGELYPNPIVKHAFDGLVTSSPANMFQIRTVKPGGVEMIHVH